MEKPFLEILQEKVAASAIGPSTFRNMGEGVIGKARLFLTQLNLREFSVKNKASYQRRLNIETNKLKKLLPIKARRWGVARKTINLFLRDAFYNRYLCDRFKLERIEYFFEIPLDRIVANRLREECNRDKNRKLPSWRGLKNLEHEDSNKYQKYAITLANKYNMARVHLDMYLFLRGNLNDVSGLAPIGG